MNYTSYIKKPIKYKFGTYHFVRKRKCANLSESNKNLIGKKINNLIVGSIFTNLIDSKQRLYCECFCDCGRKAWIRIDAIKSKERKDCGCSTMVLKSSCKNEDEYKEKQNNYSKNFRKTEEGKKYYRDYYLKRFFSLTQSEYNVILQEQENKCHICEINQFEISENFCVDHCHNTGKIRGLLCRDCNLFLGRGQDSIEFLERALLYLKNSANKPYPYLTKENMEATKKDRDYVRKKSAKKCNKTC